MPPDQTGTSWYSRAAWGALILVISLAIADAALAPTPASKQPDFIDTFLASRAVVVAIRIAIVFAALFIVLSVVVLITRRQWLTRVGPVEVEKVADLGVEGRRFEERLESAHQAIERLEEKAAYAQQMVDKEPRK